MERRIDDPSLTETVAQPRSGLAGISSSSSADEGRFIAGTLLGGRYRIIGLLDAEAWERFTGLLT
jgi:hypothetical protein